MSFRFSAIPLLAPLLMISAFGCGTKAELRTVHGQPVGHWVDELRRTSPKARRAALASLQGVGACDPSAIPAITSALKDQDATVRDAAVIALLNIGPRAKDAVNALREAQVDRDAKVRAHAVTALLRIESGG